MSAIDVNQVMIAAESQFSNSRALSCTSSANNANGVASLYVDVQVLQHRIKVVPVAQGDILEPNRAFGWPV